MNKKIKILELFAGYGSQALALKKLGYEIDSNSEIVEFGVNPSIAYNVLHKEYNQKQNFKEWQELLGSVSNDTKKIAKTIKKDKREELVNAVNKTNNFRNVLEYNIKEWFDLLTYSFPCQDLSNQGKKAGMSKNSGTRSGLLWEVERMLANTEHKPKVLLMENVKALLQKKNMEDFNEWIKTLEDLGYYNTYKVLNSAHFGVGQNRERVFMLSFLDKEAFDNFKWPEPSEEKTPFSKHMMSLEEIENSPWPLNEKDLELNEYELLQGQSGNYKLGNKIDDNEKVFSTFQTKLTVTNENNQHRTLDVRMKNYDQTQGKTFQGLPQKRHTSGEQNLTTSGTNQQQKVFNKLDFCNRINKENNPSQTTMAGMQGKSDQQLKVYSTYDTNNKVNNTNKNFRTISTRDTIADKYAGSKVYQELTPKEKYNQVRANSVGDYKKEFDLDLYSKNWSQLSVEDENNPERTIEVNSKNKIFQTIKERGGIVRFVRPLEKSRLMGLTDQEFWKLYNSILSTNEIEAMLGNSIVVDVLEEIFKNIKF